MHLKPLASKLRESLPGLFGEWNKNWFSRYMNDIKTENLKSNDKRTVCDQIYLHMPYNLK
jgi:hypothetical protein